MDFSKRKIWKYKAEGNKHVVVSDGQGSCLRLLKLDSNYCESSSLCNKDCKISFSETNSDADVNCDGNQNELLFIKCVVLPLINYCDACQVPKVVKLSPVFLHDLAQRVKLDRPKYRRHQAINCKAFSLLMKDYCFIQHTQLFDNFVQQGMSLDPNIFTIEIKLKNGFVKGYDVGSNSTFKPVCQFCKTQVFKKLEKESKVRCSSYCPLDLFSGNYFQMKKALYSLLLTPQNNLRIFRNGDLFYSQESTYSVKSKFYNEFRQVKTESDCLILLKELFSNLPNSCKTNKLDLELLVDLICKSLLIPITSNTNSSHLVRVEKCHGSFYKNKLCEDMIDLNFVAANDSNSNGNVVCSLPGNSILGVVLTQQNLDTHSFSDVFNKYQSLDSFLANNCTFKEELSVEAPYDSVGWQSFSNDPLKPQKSDKLDLTEIVAACENHQADEIIVMYLSQGHSKHDIMKIELRTC